MRRAIAGRHLGFTLVEAIVVIVITGIVAGMVAVFIRPAINAYMDSARRATLTDIADTAARRMARELQGALPNSVRVNGLPQFLEFVPIVAAGRYRAETGPAAFGDPLSFTDGTDNSFNVFGPPITVPANSSVVIYNLGILGADVYEAASPVRRTAIAGVGLTTLLFAQIGTPFPIPSPGNRFQVVGRPISYACELGTGNLWRYSGYDFQPNQPTSLATLDGLAGARRALLATQVTACNFIYGPGPLQHNGLVSLSLTFTQDGESVTLLHQVNVDNVP